MLGRYIIALGLMLVATAASADCWFQAESHFSIEARLLRAIALTESNMNPRATGKNKNGTRDIGLMQINSIHLPRLRILGINEQRLYDDTCVSVMVGASVLSDMMKRYGYSWEAVGAYNAGTGAGSKHLRMRYARRVWERYQNLESTGLQVMARPASF
ncbi:type III secretion system invasion protein IagB [Enterobacteriales bacterium SAP-6]|uniref:Type III secretion system invasion protein IagB n=1 Tax=Acerihabitans arboris TaxID=2691583 RepID=A0A845SC93_9GAMM|nr:type III secretion system invasion protein IagB [Acerihabitans arboris]NDL61529.1 type III secretion system invasion protein IagB [Acerihabitans arboris]